MKTLTITTLLTASMLTTGCLSVHLMGGRSENITVVVVGSGDAEAKADMEAASATTVRDALKDLFNPILPGEPVLPPTTPGNPLPPDITPQEPPAPIDEDGSEVFLWKPVSEFTGNFVVLTPASLSVISVQVGDETSAGPGTRANGNRQHWRFSQPGGGFDETATVIATLTDGTTQTWEIPKTSERTEL